MVRGKGSSYYNARCAASAGAGVRGRGARGGGKRGRRHRARAAVARQLGAQPVGGSLRRCLRIRRQGPAYGEHFAAVISIVFTRTGV